MMDEPPDWLEDGPPPDDDAAPAPQNGKPHASAAERLKAAAAERRATAPAETAAPPSEVWIGTFAELALLDLPEPAVVTKMGDIKIVAAETILVYGPSNLGKSLLALRVCLQAAADGAHVLVVEGEGSKRALRERVRKLAAGMRVSIDEIGSRITIAHGGFALAEQLTLWQSTLAREAFSVVMLDPLVSYFVGDENSSRDMQSFLDLVAQARSGGSAVIVVHHATKPDAEGRSRERGSSALRAWADEVVQLARGEGPSTAIVTHEKSRERGVHPTPQNFTWAFSDAMIELDVGDADAEAVETATVRRARVKLLGILAEAAEEVPTKDARRKLGNLSGERFAALLIPMIKDGRIIRADLPRKNAEGVTKVVETLRLGNVPDAPRQAGNSDEFGAP